MCYPNADIYSCVVKTQVAYPCQKYLFICTISDYLDSEKPTFDLSVETLAFGCPRIIPYYSCSTESSENSRMEGFSENDLK